MREFFADTWFLIAITNPHDHHHRIARAVATRILPYRVVTHDAVLTEVLAFFSGGGPRTRRSAASTVRRVLREFHVETVGRELFLLALDLYESRPDKEYSLVDCMSMVLMKQRGIAHVLTNDHHFRQEGFVLVNE